MPIPIVYIAVVIIWSTTPLTIFYSNHSLSAIAAVNSRMLLAFLVASIITLALGRKQFKLRQYWKVYAVSSIGIFPNMPMVYLSASYIPSGLISVLFALSPFMVAILSTQMATAQQVSKRQLACLTLALLGLSMVTISQIETNTEAWKGVILMLGSGFCFALSNTLIQTYNAKLKTKKETIHPANQLTGSLMFALPGLLITWIILDGSQPKFSQTSAIATLYLAIIGSVMGFMAYFYLLSKISALSVSLIPLLTPAFALLVGNSLNKEPLTPLMISGTVIIMLSLSLFNSQISTACMRYTLHWFAPFKKKRDDVLS